MEALRQRIFEQLLNDKLLTPQQLAEVTSRHQPGESRLSTILPAQLTITPQTFADRITAALALLNIPTLRLQEIPREVTTLVPGATARTYRLMPVELRDKTVLVAVDNPLTVLDIEDIRELQGFSVQPLLFEASLLQGLIEQYYPRIVPLGKKAQTMEDILGTLGEPSARANEEFRLAEIAQITQEVPIVKATNFILEKAIELKASDILIEPLERAMRIRLRIDGQLHQIETLPMSFHPFIVSRIKVISNLDIAEHRLPQDGQFKITVHDRQVEFRVSAIAASYGEKVVIRVLDKTSALLDIDKLGLRPENLERLKKSALLPHGMILVCGPTGSGKTTTLYSLLKFIHSPEKNIITVEDPVEYQIKGINQVAVNSKTGLTFGRCLRSILRQDPDIIMVGEIRDLETVDIAIKAALTGHLVLSTLHTTTAAGSIVRLLDMGVESFLIDASVIAIVAQRLARRICTHCREKIPDQPYYIGRGCKECLESGYSGRILVTEILWMSPAIKEAVVSKRIDEEGIKKLACAEGMATLRQEAEVFAREGVISLEEVLRVTPPD